MDDNNNKCLSEFGPIYCNLLEYANEQPVRMPTMQQLNQKRTLNKARNKLIKSSRFWGKRNVDTFNENESGLMPDTTNTDGPYRRLGHQKFGLALSSRFWG
ncbi:Uncharacterized protein BM_BM17904 [Brugia malayi]|uniref:Uncharacterized protein n=2 Tax=Brugia TaxID=6278 RepID=A0A4E9ERC0_BRUMA|nr:Uncharacterized protein BM_BM17904 [Brugia malayi]VIO86111.1 Uncharacterized protein BM_BM17904 [Brugia malayi]